MNSGKSKNYYCFVPACKTTSKSTPDKLFFNVPKGKDRSKWCKIVRREKTSLISVHHCCEDHFDLENDVEDWTRYKIMKEANVGSFKLKLKSDVVPHKFDCQVDRKQTHSKTERSAVSKRTSLGMIQDALGNAQVRISSDQTSSNLCGDSDDIGKENENPETNQGVKDTCATADFSCQNSSTLCDSEGVGKENGNPETSVVVEETTADFSCQAQLRKPYRSKGTQTGGQMMVSVATSPFKIDPRKRRLEQSEETISLLSFVSVETSQSRDPTYRPDNDLSADSGDDLSDEMLQSQQLSLTLRRMEKNPKRYLGLDPENMKILGVLEAYSQVDRLSIFIVLRKIRTNESGELLGDAFGCHKSKISRALTTGTPKIAHYLKKLIFWPEKKNHSKKSPGCV